MLNAERKSNSLLKMSLEASVKDLIEALQQQTNELKQLNSQLQQQNKLLMQVVETQANLFVLLLDEQGPDELGSVDSIYLDGSKGNSQ